MDAELIGRAACELGAGRKTKDDIIDHSAGIILCKKTGDIVCHGDILARFYTSDEVKIEKASELFARSIEFSKQKPITGDLILDIIK
jgi:pyrimidine-nucleoside phosphorylase